jgi:hypothetical protein
MARTSRSTEGRAETEGASRLVGCLLSARAQDTATVRLGQRWTALFPNMRAHGDMDGSGARSSCQKVGGDAERVLEFVVFAAIIAG